MKVDRQGLFWLAALVLFVLFLFVFQSILLPFVAGMAIAYILDPLARWFQRRGFSRLMATLTILVLFAIVFVLALLVIVPLLISEISAFITSLPELIERLQTLFASLLDSRVARFFGIDPETIKTSFSRFMSEGSTWLAAVLSSLWSGGLALIEVVSLLVITPVVAFYLLHDWDRFVAFVDGMLPLDHAGEIRQIGRDIDRTMATFVRGQGLICITLAVVYALGLTLIGLNFGFLIGFFSGLFSFIPFVGSVLGLIVAGAVAIAQFWPEWTPIIMVAAVFIVGQVLEGYVLQPWLTGTNIGLHPVWLIFALFAFGLLFGFVGLMIAVPAAAAIGVVVRYAVARYRESLIYRGNPPPP